MMRVNPLSHLSRSLPLLARHPLKKFYWAKLDLLELD